MYGALRRALPGPAWFRAILLLALAAAVVVVCFEWVFPWVSDYLPMNDNTVSDAARATMGVPGTPPR